LPTNETLNPNRRDQLSLREQNNTVLLREINQSSNTQSIPSPVGAEEMQDQFLPRRNVVVLLILSVPLINNNPHNSQLGKQKPRNRGNGAYINPFVPPECARLSTTSGKPRIPHKTSSSSSFSRSSVLQLHALKRAPLASKPNHFSLNFRLARVRLEGRTSLCSCKSKRES
jgi:hypothetical protein